MEPAEELFTRLKNEGEVAINEFIASRESESLFIDFKQSRPEKHNPNILSPKDRDKLAEAISGFGNSNGGVLIWGVDCRNKGDGADVAQFKHPIRDVKRFKSWLEQATSRCTDPPHVGVEHAVIAEDGTGNGYAATLIRSSHLAPLQCLPDLRFVIRAGSAFVPVSRAVLAGMFGRRPTPVLELRFDVGLAHVEDSKVIVVPLKPVLRCMGPSVIDRPYLTIECTQQMASNSRLVIRKLSASSWQWTQFGQGQVSMVHGGLGIAPFGVERPVNILALIQSSVGFDAKLMFTWGCDEASPTRFELNLQKQHVGSWYDANLENIRTGNNNIPLRTKASRELLQLPEPMIIEDSPALE